MMLDLFSNYASLFDGTLGTVPCEPIKLKLKPNSKPYYAKAYNVPQSIYDIAKNETEELVRIGVLRKNVPTPWAAPCLFRPKKHGGVRFITDFRKLNESIEREPFPLPNVDEVIWRMQGFKNKRRKLKNIALDNDLDFSERTCGNKKSCPRGVVDLPIITTDTDPFSAVVIDIQSSIHEHLFYLAVVDRSLLESTSLARHRYLLLTRKNSCAAVQFPEK